MSDDLRDYDNVDLDDRGRPVCRDCDKELYVDGVGRTIPHNHDRRRPFPGQFCEEHWSWLCQAGVGKCGGAA